MTQSVENRIAGTVGLVIVVAVLGGQALLEVRGAGRRTSTYLPLVAVDLGGDRSQSPDFLRALADHLATGGGVRDSPLALSHLARRG